MGEKQTTDLLASLALLLSAAASAAAQVPSNAAAKALPRPALAANGFPELRVRVRDLARVENVRANQLVGYGLVVGLNGTGDSQQSPFTIQSVVAMLQRFGLQVDPKTLRTRNVAAVIVTAEIPAFAKQGSRLDVSVASLGDAASLQGGTLLQTPLLGANDTMYVVAQGSVQVGGFTAEAGGNSSTKNHPTAGRVPSGGLVEKEIPTTLTDDDGIVRINLNLPDFENATRITTALNARFGAGTAVSSDAATVRVKTPAQFASDPVRLIAEVGSVPLQPSVPARIVLNERTGTVIIGGNVRIAPVAVAHAALTVNITSDVLISQPQPLAKHGETVVTPQTGVQAEESNMAMAELRAGATLAELVRALNALRATPRDIIAILLAIKNAGALFAEVEVQ